MLADFGVYGVYDGGIYGQYRAAEVRPGLEHNLEEWRHSPSLILHRSMSSACRARSTIAYSRCAPALSRWVTAAMATARSPDLKRMTDALSCHVGAGLRAGGAETVHIRRASSARRHEGQGSFQALLAFLRSGEERLLASLATPDPENQPLFST